MSDEFLDFTLLKKKGILDRAREIELNDKKFENNSKRVIDFSHSVKQENNSVSENSVVNNSLLSNSGDNPFGFLSSFAESSKSNSVQPVENISNENFNSDLNLKLDSLTRQIEGIFEKLNLIEGKLNGFESKVFNKT